MQILEEFWYGNLNPWEQFVRQDGEYFQALHKVTVRKEQLFPYMTQEVQISIDQLMDAQMEANAVAEKKAFILGFRLAMQIVVGALGEG